MKRPGFACRSPSFDELDPRSTRRSLRSSPEVGIFAVFGDIIPSSSSFVHLHRSFIFIVRSSPSFVHLHHPSFIRVPGSSFERLRIVIDRERRDECAEASHALPADIRSPAYEPG